MDLLDRYLQAVAFWLPRKQREDILAELADDLRAQIEEKETELGHPLTEGELAALLKQRGRPMLVANGYLPRQYLIGPLLFPTYRRVLTVVGLCYLIPWIVVAFAMLALSPTFRAGHLHDGWFQGIGALWNSWLATAFYAVGGITLVFAILERVNASSGFLKNWEPQKLPAVRERNRIPRIGSVMELVLQGIFCTWWLGCMWSPVLIDRPGLRIVLAPLWSYVFWGVGLVGLAGIAASAVNLARPYWTRPRAACRLLIDLVSMTIFGWALVAHLVSDIVIANISRAQQSHLVNAVNLWAERSLPILLIVAVVLLATDVYRIVRIKAPRSGAGPAGVALLPAL